MFLSIKWQLVNQLSTGPCFNIWYLKTSYHKISLNLKAARLVIWIIASLWNFTRTSATQLSRGLSNFRAIIQFLRLWDFVRSYNKTSYPILKQDPIVRHPIVRPYKISKPLDLYSQLYNCSEIWQAHQQQCCEWNCQISKRCHNLNYQSRGFQTSQDLMVSCLIRYIEMGWRVEPTTWGCVQVFVETRSSY